MSNLMQHICNYFNRCSIRCMECESLDKCKRGVTYMTQQEQTPDECRAEFEKWAAERCWPVKRINNPSGFREYRDFETMQLWQGWQAAWSARTAPKPAAPAEEVVERVARVINEKANLDYNVYAIGKDESIAIAKAAIQAYEECKNANS